MGQWGMKYRAWTILLIAVMATALPTRMKHEAALAAVPPDHQQDVALPQYVSVENFGDFTLAYQDTAFASQDARQAAEALSNRFAENSEPVSSVSTLHPASAALDAQNDPKAHIQLVAFVQAVDPIAPDPKAGAKKLRKAGQLKSASGARKASASSLGATAKHRGKLSSQNKPRPAKQSAGRRHPHHLAVAGKALPASSANSAEDRDNHVDFIGRLVNPTLWN
jgi:hypothetical protein